MTGRLGGIYAPQFRLLPVRIWRFVHERPAGQDPKPSGYAIPETIPDAPANVMRATVNMGPCDKDASDYSKEFMPPA